MEGFVREKRPDEDTYSPWIWLTIDGELLKYPERNEIPPFAPPGSESRVPTMEHAMPVAMPPRDLSYVVEVLDSPNSSQFSLVFSKTRPSRDTTEGSTKEYPGVGHISHLFSIDFEAVSANEARGWIRCLEVFDHVSYEPFHPVYDPDIVANHMLTAGLIRPKDIPRLENHDIDRDAFEKIQPVEQVQVPRVMQEALLTCIEYIQNQGLGTNHLFRNNANPLRVKDLVRRLIAQDSGRIAPGTTPLVVADALKVLLRRTPESLLIRSLSSMIIEAAENKEEEKFAALIALLPSASRLLLKPTIDMILNIVEHRQSTKMDLRSLSIELGPYLIDENDPNQLRDAAVIMPPLFEALVSVSFEVDDDNEYSDLGPEESVIENPEGEADFQEFAERVLYPSPHVVKACEEWERAHEGEEVVTEGVTTHPTTTSTSEPAPESASAQPEWNTYSNVTRRAYGAFASISSVAPAKVDTQTETSTRMPTRTAVTDLKNPVRLYGRNAWRGIRGKPIDTGTTPLLEQVRKVARPKVVAPNLEPFLGSAGHLPFGQTLNFSSLPEEPHPKATQEFLDMFSDNIDDVDLDEDDEAGANLAFVDPAQLRAKIHRIKTKQKLAEVKSQTSLFGDDFEGEGGDDINPLEPYNTRYTQNIRMPAFASPTLAAPALLGVQIGASLGLISENHRTSSEIPPFTKQGKKGMRSCFNSSVPKQLALSQENAPAAQPEGEGAVRPAPPPRNPKEYQGPDLSLAKCELLWKSVVALRRRIDTYQVDLNNMSNDVASDRYAAEWEDIQLYRRKHGLPDVPVPSALAKKRNKRRRKMLRTSRHNSKEWQSKVAPKEDSVSHSGQHGVHWIASPPSGEPSVSVSHQQGDGGWKPQPPPAGQTSMSEQDQKESAWVASPPSKENSVSSNGPPAGADGWVPSPPSNESSRSVSRSHSSIGRDGATGADDWQPQPPMIEEGDEESVSVHADAKNAEPDFMLDLQSVQQTADPASDSSETIPSDEVPQVGQSDSDDSQSNASASEDDSDTDSSESIPSDAPISPRQDWMDDTDPDLPPAPTQSKPKKEKKVLPKTKSGRVIMPPPGAKKGKQVVVTPRKKKAVAPPPGVKKRPADSDSSEPSDSDSESSTNEAGQLKGGRLRGGARGRGVRGAGRDAKPTGPAQRVSVFELVGDENDDELFEKSEASAPEDDGILLDDGPVYDDGEMLAFEEVDDFERKYDSPVPERELMEPPKPVEVEEDKPWLTRSHLYWSPQRVEELKRRKESARLLIAREDREAIKRREVPPSKLRSVHDLVHTARVKQARQEDEYREESMSMHGKHWAKRHEEDYEDANDFLPSALEDELEERLDDAFRPLDVPKRGDKFDAKQVFSKYESKYDDLMGQEPIAEAGDDEESSTDDGSDSASGSESEFDSDEVIEETIKNTAPDMLDFSAVQARRDEAERLWREKKEKERLERLRKKALKDAVSGASEPGTHSWWENPPRDLEQDINSAPFVARAMERKQRVAELLEHLDSLNQQLATQTPSIHTSSAGSRPATFDDPLGVRRQQQYQQPAQERPREEIWKEKKETMSRLRGELGTFDITNVVKNQSIMEKFVIMRQKEIDTEEHARQQRILARQEEIAQKLAAEKKEMLEQARRDAEDRKWRATAPRWDAKVFYADVGHHPLRRKYERGQAKLNAMQDEFSGLMVQLGRLYRDIHALMRGRTHLWPRRFITVYEDIPDEGLEPIAEPEPEPEVEDTAPKPEPVPEPEPEPEPVLEPAPEPESEEETESDYEPLLTPDHTPGPSSDEDEGL